MFGLPGFGAHKDVKTSRPAALNRTGDTAGLILISKEDIYRHTRGAEPVLLLKKGSEVDADTLPRLLKNGAKPNQFRFKMEEGAPLEDADAHILPSFQRLPEHVDGNSNPITDPEALRRLVRNRKRILVLETEQKSLKRLIDCLFVCGFNLENIRPLRMAGHLDWAIDKHRPHILIIDYNLEGKREGLLALLNLGRTERLEQIVLTVPPQIDASEEKKIRKLCAEKSIKILTKPVNRFELTRLLEE